MRLKSLRKKEYFDKLEKISDIRSYVNEGLMIDQILSSCSEILFSLDKESKYILEILGKNGPLSEYQLTIIGNNYNLSRDSIRRRILGTSTIPSLLESDFVNVIKIEKHRTGKEIKTYGLTLKGLLGAITRIKFEDTYLVKKYYSEMKKLLPNEQTLIDLASLYAKYHVAIIMMWCKLNNLNLLLNHNISNFFLEGITNHYLRIGFLTNIDNDNDWNNFIKAGTRYFVLKHTLYSIVKGIHPNAISHLYSDRRTKHIFNSLKNRRSSVKEFFAKYLIKDWAMNLEVSSLSSLEKDGLPWTDYGNDQPLDYSMLWLQSQRTVNELYSMISRKLKLRKSTVKMFSYHKYK